MLANRHMLINLGFARTFQRRASPPNVMRLACTASVACTVLLVAFAIVDTAVAGSVQLPSVLVEVDPASESVPNASGEQANRLEPRRARPAPADGLDLPRGPDAALAPATAIVGPVPGPSRSFEGISNGQQSTLFPTALSLGTLKLPADTTGDIGPNHYVQAVNTSYSVFARDGTPPRRANPVCRHVRSFPSEHIGSCRLVPWRCLRPRGCLRPLLR